MALSGQGGAKSGAVGARGGADDLELAEVVTAWPVLSEGARTAVLRIVRAAVEAG